MKVLSNLMLIFLCANITLRCFASSQSLHEMYEEFKKKIFETQTYEEFQILENKMYEEF